MKGTLDSRRAQFSQCKSRQRSVVAAEFIVRRQNAGVKIANGSLPFGAKEESVAESLASSDGNRPDLSCQGRK